MSSVVEQLRHRAQAEIVLATAAGDATWPQYVERTYHVGRASAFLEAAQIAETKRAIEGGRRVARR